MNKRTNKTKTKKKPAARAASRPEARSSNLGHPASPFLEHRAAHRAEVRVALVKPAEPAATIEYGEYVQLDDGTVERKVWGTMPRPVTVAGVALVRAAPAPGAIERATLVDDAKEFIAASLSPATRRAYASDWKFFAAWCAEHSVVSLPAEPATVVLYLTTLARAGKKTATIERAKTSISVAHDTAAVKNPTNAAEVKRAMQGIANTIGTRPNKKAAVLGDDVEKMIRAALNGTTAFADTKMAPTPTTRGMRDAALLALGFAGGFRRSELAVIRVEHLRWDDRSPDRVAVLIPKSKTDQEGKGRWVGIAHATTVALLRAWIGALERHHRRVHQLGESGTFAKGAIFVAIRGGVLSEVSMTAESVAEVVKKWALVVGLDPKQYAGHSLRRGFVTTAKRNGKKNEDIMRQTGHKSVEVFMGYIEEEGIFENNASEGLWGSDKSAK